MSLLVRGDIGPRATLSNWRGNGEEMDSMTYDQINPKTGKVKEYKNSAEWLKDVEEATAKPQEKKPEVKTFADAMKRYNKELGIRDPAAEKAAADADFIKKQVAEGISAALAKQQAQTANQTPKPTTQAHSAGPRYRFYDGQEDCGCKAHKPTAQTAIHSARGTGPVMEMHAVRAGKPK